MTIGMFFESYVNSISKLLKSEPATKIAEMSEMFVKCNNRGGKVIIIGNGGSSAIASHVSVDLTKAADIKAICFSDPSLLTCFANDFGYENAYKKALEYYSEKKDLAILISSSGSSQNILNAANACKKKDIEFITFSGFSSKNYLRNLGKINFYVSSENYNFVETVHCTWLLAAVDYVVYKKTN